MKHAIFQRLFLAVLMTGGLAAVKAPAEAYTQLPISSNMGRFGEESKDLAQRPPIGRIERSRDYESREFRSRDYRRDREFRDRDYRDRDYRDYSYRDRDYRDREFRDRDYRDRDYRDFDDDYPEFRELPYPPLILPPYLFPAPPPAYPNFRY